jgi:hypothetical protein
MMITTQRDRAIAAVEVVALQREISSLDRRFRVAARQRASAAELEDIRDRTDDLWRKREIAADRL